MIGLTSEEIKESILDEEDEVFVTDVDPDYDTEDGSGDENWNPYQSSGSHYMTDILSDSEFVTDLSDDDDEDEMFVRGRRVIRSPQA